MAFKNVQRGIKNFAYTEVERKVRTATNNDPWGPSTLLMSKIAEDTKDPTNFKRIMVLIFHRLDEDRKQWRHIFKALCLLEYLLKAGDLKVKAACINNSARISKLRHFQLIEDGVDRGAKIHELVESILFIIRDEEAFEKERQRSAKTRERCLGESSSSKGVCIDSAATSGPSKSAEPSKFDQRYAEWKKRKELKKIVKATKKFGQENALQLALALSEVEVQEVQLGVEQEEEMIQTAIEQSKSLEHVLAGENRPFSPPPILPSASSSKTNVIEEIANEIMELDFYQPVSPIPTSPQQLLNDSFKVTPCTPTTPSSKNLPDFTSPSFNPFDVPYKSMIQSAVTPSLLTPQSQILPDISLSFDPFADASAKSLLHNSASTGYLPELHHSVGGGDTLVKSNSSNNVKKKWNLSCVIPFPPKNYNDPWTSTPTSTTNFDFFKKDTVTPTLSANGSNSNEAYQGMESDFQHLNFMATTSQNYQSTTELSTQLTPSKTNTFLNDVISINGQQYSPTNPFVKDLLFK